MRKNYYSPSYVSGKYINRGEELHENIKNKYRAVMEDIRVIGQLCLEKEYKLMIQWLGFLMQDKEYLAYLKEKANEIDRTR